MARKKKDEISVNSFDNIYEALTLDTGFQLGDNSQVLTTRNRVRTPIEALNCLLGGGLPFGTIIQGYGLPKVGKSTWMYQMMAIFQQTYSNGISAVVDNESSADGNRLIHFGVDPGKILRLPASSIESGFLSLMKMLDNKKKVEALKHVPVFVIWDTLAKGLAQDESTQSRMNAQDRARIIKNYLSPLMAEIEKHDFILCLLNQVIYTSDRYGNRKMDSGGGVALKHDVHLSTLITPGWDEKDGGFLVRRWSYVLIDKSKIGPEVEGIPICLDAREGGKIDEIDSFSEYLIGLEWIEKDGNGYYRLDKIVNSERMNPFFRIISDANKGYRPKENFFQMVKETPAFYHTMRLKFMDFLSGMYKLQSKVIEDYRQECLEILRDNYYDPAEYYLVDNQEKRSMIVEKVRNDETLLARLSSRIPDCEAICLDCGEVHDSMYGSCECGSEQVVSQGLAEDILASCTEDKKEAEVVAEDIQEDMGN